MDEKVTAIWDKARKSIAEGLNKQSFATWIEPMKPVSLSGNKFVFEVTSRFFRDWTREHYADVIRIAVAEAAGIAPTDLTLEFTLAGARSETLPSFERAPETATEPQEGGLNARYTFQRFVIGESNRLAHAASLAVAESPAKAYNPLFIYGGVGLGKSHLMHAIGHFIAKKFPAMKISYVTSEKFTNQLIDAIQNRRMPRFRNLYRSVDVLLIDDIHFLAGKESTQEEFFHTFNALYDSHKQIVITSDRSPKDLRTLEERLVSRFEWGLPADIQPPDFELRMAILRQQAAELKVEIPQEVNSFIARNFKYNIRELEGALNRVLASCRVEGRPIDAETAQQALKALLPAERGKQITIDLIQKKVAEHYGLRAMDLKVKKRTMAVVLPRQVAMYLSRELTASSLPEIGNYFGGRDHSTVIHACKAIADRIPRDESLRKTIEYLAELIRE